VGELLNVEKFNGGPSHVEEDFSVPRYKSHPNKSGVGHPPSTFKFETELVLGGVLRYDPPKICVGTFQFSGIADCSELS